MQDEEFSKTCVCSFITSYNPQCDKILSIVIPSKFVVSCLYQLVHLALKSPTRTAIYEVLCITRSRVSSKFFEKDSNSSDD